MTQQVPAPPAVSASGRTVWHMMAGILAVVLDDVWETPEYPADCTEPPSWLFDEAYATAVNLAVSNALTEPWLHPADRLELARYWIANTKNRLVHRVGFNAAQLVIRLHAAIHDFVRLSQSHGDIVRELNHADPADIRLWVAHVIVATKDRLNDGYEWLVQDAQAVIDGRPARQLAATD